MPHEAFGGRVNLTRLVDAGEYADILNAVAGEVSNHPKGTEFVIEPGTYQVSSERTILESDFKVAATGIGHKWNDAGETAPVVIEWTGPTGGGEVMLTIGDDSTKVEGVEFEGIEFAPQNDDDPVTAIHFGGGATAPVRDVVFHRCNWRHFGAKPITRNTELDNFDIHFNYCGFHQNSGTAEMGKQTTLDHIYLQTSPGVDGIQLGAKSEMWGGVADIVDAEAAIVLTGGLCQVHPKNLEGDGTAGQIGVRVNDSANDAPSTIGGLIAGTDIGVKAEDGDIQYVGRYVNIGSTPVWFAGAANAHNDSYALVRSQSEIRVDNNQDLFVMCSNQESGVSSPPRGAFFLDTDPAGDGSQDPRWRFVRYDGTEHQIPVDLLDANDDIEADHLSAGNLPAHASRHSDGGADELDAADLSGALGTAGQFLQTDGAALTYADVAFTDLTGTASLAQLAEILDGSNQVETAHLANAFRTGPSDTAIGTTFGTIETVDAERPTEVTVQATVRSEGGQATVSLLIDESGGTGGSFAADRTYVVVAFDADSGALAGAPAGEVTGTLSKIVPAGATYQVENTANPAAGNTLDAVGETTF